MLVDKSRASQLPYMHINIYQIDTDPFEGMSKPNFLSMNRNENNKERKRPADAVLARPSQKATG